MAELSEFKRNLRKVLSNADEVAAMGLDFWSLAPSLVPFAWFDVVANIPTGWQVCDGTNGTPAMDGYFVVGSSTVAGMVTSAVAVAINDHVFTQPDAHPQTTPASAASGLLQGNVALTGATTLPQAGHTHVTTIPAVSHANGAVDSHSVTQYVPPSVSFIWIMKV